MKYIIKAVPSRLFTGFDGIIVSDGIGEIMTQSGYPTRHEAITSALQAAQWAGINRNEIVVERDES